MEFARLTCDCFGTGLLNPALLTAMLEKASRVGGPKTDRRADTGRIFDPVNVLQKKTALGLFYYCFSSGHHLSRDAADDRWIFPALVPITDSYRNTRPGRKEIFLFSAGLCKGKKNE